MALQPLTKCHFANFSKITKIFKYAKAFMVFNCLLIKWCYNNRQNAIFPIFEDSRNLLSLSSQNTAYYLIKFY
jgi:hypothetical protein